MGVQEKGQSTEIRGKEGRMGRRMKSTQGKTTASMKRNCWRRGDYVGMVDIPPKEVLLVLT